VRHFISKRVVWLLLAASSSLGCGSATQAAPIDVEVRSAAPCPDALTFLNDPIELEMRLVASFNACEGESRDFRVRVDDREPQTVRVPCADVVEVVRAPPPSYPLEPVVVQSGSHELHVVDASTGKALRAELVLPAVQVTSDGGSLMLGAHVQIRVDDDLVTVGEPTALPTKGL